MSETPKPTIIAPPRAKLRQPRFQLVWLIPIVAALIAGYLGYRTALEQGPLLTLTFASADGLTAGQTQIKYKAVALGTVESIDLAHDNSHVVVQVRMNNVGARFLTQNARFWVERPRFNISDVSGIETLLSGAYIAVDPGAPGGAHQVDFTGLEEPPGVRSDEPGSTYVLNTRRVGSLNSGSPVYFRDVQVGEVLGYDIGDGLGPVKVTVFIRAPFNHLVRPDSLFWNISGVALGIEGGVLQLQLQSVQALLAGGIAFTLPDAARSEAPSPDNASFPLYPTEQVAKTASYHTQIKLVTYMTSDVSGLTQGAPVQQLGIQIGVVSGVTLEVDEAHGTARVRVDMQVQPERIDSAASLQYGLNPQADMQRLVDHGMRAELGTASYVTGQKLIELTTVPNAPPAQVTREGDALVIPSADGGLDATIATVNDIAAKLDKMPIQQIGDNLNKLLISTNSTLGGPRMKQTLAQLDQTLATANTTLQMLNQGFGTDSDFQRGLTQLLQQTNATEKSVQSLSDYINRHPQALLLGRGGK
jgi:paraquat-inducible protein B